ncbi:glycosyltransferase family 4 protein [Eubacterium sp. MSJ-33]|uniref:glycosyltransferase family 4 protein n=1 Tax=Eubacterium sp. MSJ-33 TaxID=2841528 RepID=UPI001C777EB1|nr:glycosyltransferase family 1 protein [Eubacterium sp. MSJ-33]QWT52112.1 glycosyltransferase family 4 protein [Eubacterium sp. MSJ-33]
MKIFVDLTSLADNFSGIERFALSITQELVKHAEHTYILAFKNEIHPAFQRKLPNVRRMVIRGRNKLIFAQLTFPGKLWRVRADCYLFPAFPAPFLFFSKKAVSAIHDVGCWDCPETNKRSMIVYFRILYRKVAMCGKRIITVSEFSKGRIVERLHVKPERVAVIYDGVSECFTKFAYEEAMDIQVRERLELPEHYILCLSTLEPRKNMRFLIEAYAKMRYNKKVNRELVLVGRKGWMVDTLLDDIPDDVKQHIHLTGFVGDDELPYVYHDADIFVFTSIYEGFGMPPVEALTCGTSVLSSDAASMPEVLGGAAEYFQSGNMQDLMEKLQQMLESKHKRSYDTIRQYDWGEEAGKLLEILKEEGE